MSNRNGWRALASTRAQGGLLVLGWVALAACQQATQQNRLSVPVEPTKAADDDAESGAPLLVALDDQPDEAMLARALCDVVGECAGGATAGSEEGEGGEETAAEGEGGREVHHELADLDADGRNEVLVRVRQHDYVLWHVLARREDEYVSLYELADNGTDIRAVQNASGRPLLLLEHDCCCQYNLQVLALEGDTFERLFSWGSACEDGCDSGYEAHLMLDDAQRLTSIALPEGVCGADGTTYIDTTTWEPAGS